MEYRSIGDLILKTMRNDKWTLSDRLYGVLTGPILAVGPPWPEDPEAYRLLGDLDQMMRRLQKGLPDPGVDKMLSKMSDAKLNVLAGAVVRVGERLAIRPDAKSIQ